MGKMLIVFIGILVVVFVGVLVVSIGIIGLILGVIFGIGMEKDMIFIFYIELLVFKFDLFNDIFIV